MAGGPLSGVGGLGVGYKLSLQTRDLLTQIASLRGQITATGNTPVADSNNPVELAKSVAGSMAPSTIATEKDAYGRGKLNLSDLPFDVRQQLESAQRIKDTTQSSSSGWSWNPLHDIAHAAGDVKNAGETALSRVTDVLSRGQYAVSDAVKHAYDEAVSHGSNTPGGILKDIIYGAKGFGEGAAAGITGKEKGNFEDYIQHVADAQHFKDQGATGAESVTEANAHPGTAHVNPWLKSGVGLAGDLFLDPTTYVGAGAVGKVLKGEKEVKIFETGSKIAKSAETLGTSSEAEMRKALGLDEFSAGKFRKSVLPTAAALNKTRTESPKILMDYANKAADVSWQHYLSEAKKTVPFPTGEGKIAGKYSEEAQGVADQRLYKTNLEAKAGEISGETRRTIRDNAFDHLTAIQRKMTSPSIRREMGVTLAGKHLGSIPVEKLAKKAEDLQASDSLLGKALRAHQKTFINSAGVRKDVREFFVGEHGRMSNVDHAYRRLTHDLYDSADEGTRKRVLQNYINGDNSSVLNGKGKDLTRGFINEIGRIGDSVKSHVGDYSSISEFQKHLPDSMANVIPKSSAEPKEWLKSGLVHYEKHSRRRVLVPNDDWLHTVAKKWASSTDKNVADPSHILYYANRANLSASAEASTYRSLGEHLGQSVYQSERKFGSAAPYLQRQAEQYKLQGHREAKIPGGNRTIPYLKGVVFPPEIADQVGKLYHSTHNVFNEGDYGKVGQNYDKAMRVWKSLVTKYSPGYYGRNMIGEVLAGFFGGVDNPHRYLQAGKVLHGRDRTLMGDGQEFIQSLTGTDPLKKREIRAANALHFDPNVAAGSQHIINIKLPGGSIQKLTADQIFHSYTRNGLKTAFMGSDLDTNLENAKTTLGNFLEHTNQKVQTGAEFVEDLPRMAHFIDQVTKQMKIGKSFEEASATAAKEVRKYHFDFTDFTPAEQKIMTRIAPFYKWTRKNIPLMLEMTLSKPGRTLVPLKTLTAMSESQGYANNGNRAPAGDLVVPQWLRDDLGVPVGQSGKNTVYEDAPVPWMQAFEFLQHPIQGAGLMTNPLAQYAIAKTTGKLPSGEPAHSLPGGIAPDSLAGPQYAFIKNLINGRGKTNAVTLTQFLTGLGLNENTENRMYAEAKREQQNAVLARTKTEKKAGTYKSTRHPGVY